MSNYLKFEVAMATADDIGKRLEARQRDLEKRVLHLKGSAEAGIRLSKSIQTYLETTKQRLMEQKIDLDDVKKSLAPIMQCALLAERQAKADAERAQHFQIQIAGVLDGLTIAAQVYKREESKMLRQIELAAEAEPPPDSPPSVPEDPVAVAPVALVASVLPTPPSASISEEEVVEYARSNNHAALVAQAKERGLSLGGRKKDLARRILEAP